MAFWQRQRPRIYTQDTQVGKYQVPVKRARFLTLGVATAGAHGKKERGDYAFWTAVLKVPGSLDKRHLGTGGTRRPQVSMSPLRQQHQVRCVTKITARALAWLPAGDRFYRMSVEMDTLDIAYRELWVDLLGKGGNIAYIRPATLSEVKRWLATHPDDKRYLKIRKRP